MNFTKKQKEKEEREKRTLEETKLNIQKKDFDELGIEIL